MLNTKLVLIEGLPGSGKSSSTLHLGKILQQQGIHCRYFREGDHPHPIDCLDFEIKGLTSRMVPLWATFVNEAAQEGSVTVIESRLWQNTALFMYMSEAAVTEILNFHQQIWRVLTPLSPILIYLDQENTDTALRTMFAVRGESFMEETLKATLSYPWFKSRSITDLAGWIRFFEEWHGVAEKLYDDWPHAKIRIMNPHENWAKAYEQIYGFMQIESNGYQ